MKKEDLCDLIKKTEEYIKFYVIPSKAIHIIYRANYAVKVLHFYKKKYAFLFKKNINYKC